MTKAKEQWLKLPVMEAMAAHAKEFAEWMRDNNYSPIKLVFENDDNFFENSDTGDLFTIEELYDKYNLENDSKSKSKSTCK